MHLIPKIILKHFNTTVTINLVAVMQWHNSTNLCPQKWPPRNSSAEKTPSSFLVLRVSKRLGSTQLWTITSSAD